MASFVNNLSTSLVRRISDRFARKGPSSYKCDYFDDNGDFYQSLTSLESLGKRNYRISLEIFEPKDERRDEKPETIMTLILGKQTGKQSRKFIIFRHEKAQEVWTMYARVVSFLGVFKHLPKRRVSAWIESAVQAILRHPCWRPYHLAAFMGCTAYFKKRRARVYNMPAFPDGLTPLMIAVREGHLELVLRLLELKVEARAVDHAGLCVMDHVKESDHHLIELLIDALPRDFLLHWCAEHRSPKSEVVSKYIAQTETQSQAPNPPSPLSEVLSRTPTSPAKLKDMLSVFDFELHSPDLPNCSTWLHAASNKRSLLSLLELKSMEMEVNARDRLGRTALLEHTARGWEGNVMALFGYWSDVNVRDIEGNTALHYAVMNESIDMIKLLLCVGVCVNMRNNYGETARHIAARMKNASEMIAVLAIRSARVCNDSSRSCLLGCIHPKSKSYQLIVPFVPKKINGNFNTDDPYASELTKEMVEEKPNYDMHAHMASLRQMTERLKVSRKNSPRVISALSLDGGGIRGLVLTQVLVALEEVLDRPLADYFDWIASTSTGACVGANATVGNSVREGQRIYLRFKDDVFERRVRPYDAAVLEKFYRSVFGDDKTLSETSRIKNFFCTTNDATLYPAQLLLMRNYEAKGASLEYGDIDPSGLEIWRAVRRSSAAPTYFAASEQKFVDGGLSSNNPTLDLLAELHHWNTHCPEEERVELGCLLSVGTGQIPPQPIDPAQIEMASMFGMVKGFKNLFNMVMAQVTATDGAVVTRSRAWTQSLGAVYFRLCPLLSKEYPLDTKSDADVISLMWECVIFAYSNKKQLEEIADVLRTIGPSSRVRERNVSSANQALSPRKKRPPPLQLPSFYIST